MEITAGKNEAGMKWEMVKLGDIVKMVTGKTPPTSNADYFDGDYLWVNPSDFGSKYITESKRTVTQKAIDEKKCNLLPKGTILLSCIGDIGKIGILKTQGASNQQITGLITKENVIPDYLFYFLMHNKSKLESLANKAVVSILNNERLRELEVILPPLPIQKRIAEILDAADALRRKDQALLQKYDELAQAIFMDMFGDPVRNEKGWKKKIATEYYEVRGRVGWKGYKKTDLRQKGAIVLGATHVTENGEIDLTKVVYLSNEKFIESPEIVVQKDDLIFVQRGNTIGKVGLVKEELGDATINPVVLIFRPKNTNPLFLLNLLLNKEQNREFVSSNSGSAQPMITQEFMRNYLFIDIPRENQEIFATRIKLVEVQKAKARFSCNFSDSLFNSLLQKAFKGELVS